MKHKDYLAQIEQDPEYLEGKEALRWRFALADTVLLARTQRGWSQTELARRAGAKQTTISNIEAGLANPRLDLIKRVIEALQLDISFTHPTTSNEEPETPMQTFEQRAIQAELNAITDSAADLRDALYHFGNKFHVIKIAGYRLRFERRKARASDWRIGLGVIGMAGLMSLAFVLDKSLVPAFINSAPYFGVVAVLGMFAAAARRIRVSDWFAFLYLASYILASLTLLPVIFIERDIPPFLAAGGLFGTSLALFMNIVMFFYALTLRWAPASRQRWHEVGA